MATLPPPSAVSATPKIFTPLAPTPGGLGGVIGNRPRTAGLPNPELAKNRKIADAQIGFKDTQKMELLGKLADLFKAGNYWANNWAKYYGRDADIPPIIQDWFYSDESPFAGAMPQAYRGHDLDSLTRDTLAADSKFFLGNVNNGVKSAVYLWNQDRLDKALEDVEQEEDETHRKNLRRKITQEKKKTNAFLAEKGADFSSSIAARYREFFAQFAQDFGWTLGTGLSGLGHIVNIKGFVAQIQANIATIMDDRHILARQQLINQFIQPGKAVIKRTEQVANLINDCPNPTLKTLLIAAIQDIRSKNQKSIQTVVQEVTRVKNEQDATQKSQLPLWKRMVDGASSLVGVDYIKRDYDLSELEGIAEKHIDKTAGHMHALAILESIAKHEIELSQTQRGTQSDQGPLENKATKAIAAIQDIQDEQVRDLLTQSVWKIFEDNQEEIAAINEKVDDYLELQDDILAEDEASQNNRFSAFVNGAKNFVNGIEPIFSTPRMQEYRLYTLISSMMSEQKFAEFKRIEQLKLILKIANGDIVLSETNPSADLQQILNVDFDPTENVLSRGDRVRKKASQLDHNDLSKITQKAVKGIQRTQRHNNRTMKSLHQTYDSMVGAMAFDESDIVYSGVKALSYLPVVNRYWQFNLEKQRRHLKKQIESHEETQRLEALDRLNQLESIERAIAKNLSNLEQNLDEPHHLDSIDNKKSYRAQMASLPKPTKQKGRLSPDTGYAILKLADAPAKMVQSVWAIGATAGAVLEGQKGSDVYTVINGAFQMKVNDAFSAINTVFGTNIDILMNPVAGSWQSYLNDYGVIGPLAVATAAGPFAKSALEFNHFRRAVYEGNMNNAHYHLSGIFAGFTMGVGVGIMAYPPTRHVGMGIGLMGLGQILFGQYLYYMYKEPFEDPYNYNLLERLGNRVIHPLYALFRDYPLSFVLDNSIAQRIEKTLPFNYKPDEDDEEESNPQAA